MKKQGQLYPDYFGPIDSHELIAEFLGEFIAKGVTREVYACKVNPAYVIKIAKSSEGVAANVLEHSIWAYAEMMPESVSQWFCPCVSISSHGSVLVMRRAEPVSEEELPQEVPAYFTDLKPDNWGLLEGKPVCVDYANTLIYNGFHAKKTRKANWSDPSA